MDSKINYDSEEISKLLKAVLRNLHSINSALQKQNRDNYSVDEACKYLRISKSFLYKLSSQGLIGFYKPNGKKIYFSKKHLDDWLKQNEKKTREEICSIGTNYIFRKNK